ncbi:YeeE/YedE family protein [Elioraea sp.]|uniref:YeeE/YedE family protein n=1 Tax=Elioraea sp. TaxID=2185103 RepID=UPI0025BFC160|nr:YeeE/YedE family protein [Elioraea sp.]
MPELDFPIGTQGQVILGGALIGLALALLRLLAGNVMSASRMLGSLLGGHEGPAAVSIAFLAGLMLAPSILAAVGAAATKPIEAGWALLVVGGLLVGVGARLGDGGLVVAIFGAVRRSGWAAASVCAIAVGAGVSLLARQILAGGGTA